MSDGCAIVMETDGAVSDMRGGHHFVEGLYGAVPRSGGENLSSSSVNLG